jgi:DNA-binding Lrp family transcriptional regulator
MSQQLFENLESISNDLNFSNIFEKMMLELYPKVKELNSQIALDLGFLFIYRYLEDDDEKYELLDFWREKSTHQIVQLPMGEFHYRPYIDFIYLDKIMNGLFLETVLEQMSKFQNLSFYESCAILFDLERYYVVPLSEMDVRIIKTIRDLIDTQQYYTNELLSKKLQVRSNYISRRIGYLRNNAYFRVTGTVNFPRIGLNLYIILIESTPEFQESISKYFSSPYTRTIRRCPNQRFDYIVSLTIPKIYEEKLFEYLVKLSDSNKIRSFYCDEVKTISNNLNFTYYTYSKRPSVLSANKPGFFIDWFKERILSMTESSDDSTKAFHRFSFEGNPVKFSEIDLKVMTLFRRDLDSSVRTISKRLSLSWEDTNFHIERIKELMFPMILLYYMGLNQSAILFYEKISKENLNSIEKIILRMPQTFSYTFRNGGAIITVDLMNGAHRLNDLVCETLPIIKNTQFSLASKTSGIFRPIPYKFYKENKWVFPNNFFLFNEIE